MFASLTLTLALLTPSAPVPKDLAPAGQPPVVVELRPNSDGQVLVSIRREEKRKVAGPVANNPNGAPEREITAFRSMRVELSDVKDLQITTAGGKAIDKKEALAKIHDGAIVVLTTDGKKVDAQFLRIFKDDTLVLVSPELVGSPRGGRPFPSTSNVLPPVGQSAK